MKSVKIKGKDYIEVNERLMYFRDNYDGYRLITEIIELKNDRVVMKASVIDKDGIVIATGHAYEKEGSTYINKTSYIENCETSAWGRALGNFGIGIDTAIASADEVVNAVNKQDAEPVNLMTTDQKTQLHDLLIDAGLEPNLDNKSKLAKKYSISASTTAEQASKIINQINADFASGQQL